MFLKVSSHEVFLKVKLWCDASAVLYRLEAKKRNLCNIEREESVVSGGFLIA